MDNDIKYNGKESLELQLASQLIPALEETIKNNYKLDVNVEQSITLRTNMESDILVVRFKDSNISPTIYLDDVLRNYENGMTIEQLSHDLAKSVVMAYQHSPILPKFTVEEAKKSVSLTVMNAAKNAKLLENVPHFLVGDLAAVPRWYLSDEASFIVTNEIASKLMLTGEELLQIGQQNINNTKFEIVPMADMLQNLAVNLNISSSDLDAMQLGSAETNLIIMTNQNRLQGANAILSKDALTQVYEKMQHKSFYILPSSIHEVICISADSGVSQAYLKEMVREINAIELSPKDFLADEIMKFDGTKISVVRDDFNFDSCGGSDGTITFSGMKM